MDVRLPNLGEGADSGSVVNMLVKEGDLIQAGQTILELENEKAVAPIPSPADGRVEKIRVKAGDKLSVGQIILTLASEAGGKPVATSPSASVETVRPRSVSKLDPPAPAVSTTAAENEFSPRSSPAGVPPPAAPSIRKLAQELGIDLSRVRGSEAGGRIVLKDVRNYIERLQQIAFAAQSEKAPPAKATAESIDFAKWGPVHKQPVSSLRRIIGQRMAESWTTIPHVTQFEEADITDLMALRKKWGSAYEAQGARLTLTCFALEAVVQVLEKFPAFNASLDEAAQEIVFKDYFHIGLAVDTEAGLIVPVIRDVDRKSLLVLAKELGELAVRARDRKVSLEELKGGSFTISNQGGIGGAHFTPLVNKPEVAILGLGRGVLKPAVRGQQIEPRLMLPLCLSYDHRVIDGGQAARFIEELRKELEGFGEEKVGI